MGKIKKNSDDEDTHPRELLRENLNKCTNKIITKDGQVKKKVVKHFTAYKCDVCQKKFDDKSKLTSHMKSHSDECYACPVCPYVGRTKKYLARHRTKAHTAPTKNKCTVCGKMFHYACKLREHAMIHTGEKPHKCNVCGKAFRVTFSLNSHMLIHKNERPFKCSFCEYACRDNSSLRKHENRHMGVVKSFPCKLCPKKFPERAKLKYHISDVHLDYLDLDLRSYPCAQCGKTFRNKYNRNKHVQSVHEKLFVCKCPVCGQTISDKANLSAHLRTHFQERPYICTHDNCTKRFKDKSTLKKHTIIHQVHLQHSCRVCGAMFTRLHRLRSHLATHAPRDKWAECHHCGVKFYSKNYLIKHIRAKHSKNRQKYICDQCGLKTYNKPSIVMHLKYGHLNDNDLYCKMCKRRYKHHMYLKAHYLKTHNIRYKAMKRSKRKVSKPSVEIKVEPLDLDICEEIHIIDIPKKEIVEEEDPNIENNLLPYSKHVLSEDLAQVLLTDDHNQQTNNFDEFLLNHVFRKKVKDEPPEQNQEEVNKTQLTYVTEKVKDIIQKSKQIRDSEIQERKKEREAKMLEKKLKREAKILRRKRRLEIYELEKVRQVYNERMKAAAVKEGSRKEPVKTITYFKQKTNIATNTTTTDKNTEENNSKSSKKSTSSDGTQTNLIKSTSTNKDKKLEQTNDEINDTNDISSKNMNSVKDSNVINGAASNENTVNDSYFLSSNAIIKEEDSEEMNDTSLNYATEMNDISLNNASEMNDISLNNASEMNDISLNNASEMNDISLNNASEMNDISLNNASEMNDISLNNATELNDISLNNATEMNDISINDATEMNYITLNNGTEMIIQENYDTISDVNNEIRKLSDREIVDVSSITINNEVKNTGSKDLINDSNNENIKSSINSSSGGNNPLNNSIHHKNICDGEKDTTNDKNVCENNKNDSTIDTNVDPKTDSTTDPNKRVLRSNASVNDNTEGDDSNDDKSDKDDSNYEPNLDSDNETTGKKRLTFKTRQCYICFKLYPSKEELFAHCQSHFDYCNKTTLSKCPVCAHVASSSIRKHMLEKHGIQVKIPYNRITDRKDNSEGSRYCYKVDDKGTLMEIIPSVKILNHNASMELDKRKREQRDKTIAKTKLVKKGKEWIVETVAVNISFEELPEFTKQELSKLKISDSYVDRLGQLSRLAKKRGVKMVFPCDSCAKICQNFSGLKLHSRRHDPNKKPFAPKVYKHRRNKPGVRAKPAPVKIKPKMNLENRLALPKPIINNHKCDDRLKDFYENNIRGADIEFWQFLKIFNKMDRENIQDFKDLEGRPEFGIHTNEDLLIKDPECSQESTETSKTVQPKLYNTDEDSYNSDSDTPLKSDATTSKTAQSSSNINSSSKSKRKVTSNKKPYKRVIMISKKQHLEREKARKKMRQNLET